MSDIWVEMPGTYMLRLGHVDQVARLINKHGEIKAEFHGICQVRFQIELSDHLEVEPDGSEGPLALMRLD